MSKETQEQLAQTPQGRMILHFCCMFRDKKFVYHIKGIHRELTKIELSKVERGIA